MQAREMMEIQAQSSPGLQVMLGRLGLALRIDGTELGALARRAGAPPESVPDIMLLAAPASPGIRHRGLVKPWIEVERDAAGSVSAIPRHRFKQTVIVGITEEDAQRKNGIPASFVAAEAVHYASEQAALFTKLDQSPLPVFAAHVGWLSLRQGWDRARRYITGAPLMPSGLIDVQHEFGHEPNRANLPAYITFEPEANA